MTHPENQYVGFFRNWEMNQSTEEQIQSELELQGIPSSQIESILTMYKKNTQQKRQYRGFMFMGIGAFIGFLSCVLTMLDLVPELRGIALYGLTSIGVGLAFLGAYYVFE
ncbi:MAG: hypothetical protein WCP57_12650 [Bacteroidota bacterium]